MEKVRSLIKIDGILFINVKQDEENRDNIIRDLSTLFHIVYYSDLENGKKSFIFINIL